MTGTELAGKSDLINEIFEITGIPIAVLHWPGTVQSYSIARRMSWASDRKTTRAEDEAYSLLGIFDVNMPLVYGEGRNAFPRLQEELLRRSDDESVFVHSEPNILAQHPAAFPDSRRIVPLKRTEFPQPFSMTNIGIYIKLLLLQKDAEHGADMKSSVYGVLNCHRKND